MPRKGLLYCQWIWECHLTNNFETKVEIYLKIGNGKSRGNKIAVLTELAPTKRNSLKVKKAVRKLNLVAAELHILMKPQIIAYNSSDRQFDCMFLKSKINF